MKRELLLRSLIDIKDRLFYGWIVVAACLFLNTVVFGIRYSFGVFFESLESNFELTRAVTSGIFSTYMVLCCGIAMLGGWALDRYGPKIITLIMAVFTALSLILTSQTSDPWQLFVYYGLFFAIGTGAAYTIVMSTASRWFDRKRGLALGIVSSGAGLGIVIIAPFATYLITMFDWRMAFIVIGAIAGISIALLAALLKKEPAEIGAMPDGSTLNNGGTRVQNEKEVGVVGLTLKQAFYTRSFWSLMIIWFLWSTCLHFVLTHIVPHAIDLGISAGKASFVLALVGLVSIPARLVIGGVSDRIGRKISAIICALLQAGAMVWLIWSQELWMLYLFAFVYGIGYGGFDPPTVALIGDTFGLSNLGMVMGALVVGWGAGAAFGPAVGGFIYDVNESYFVAFLAGALLMLVCALLVPVIRQKADRKIYEAI